MDSSTKYPDDEIDLSNDVRKVGKHYVAIGEHADLWKGELSYLGSSHPRRVAIKLLRGGTTSKPNFSENLRQELERCGRIWTKLRHDNVARFYGLAFNCGVMPALILEYYPNGNIVEFVKVHNLGHDAKMRLITEIALGMQYLHGSSPPVIHGDIRGANVLINEEKHAVLADYGLAFIIDSSEFTSVKTAGTCRWTAPEIMNPEDDDLADTSPLFTLSSDIFAYAMTIIEVFTEVAPFPEKKNDSAVIFAILGGKRPEIPSYIQAKPEISSLIQSCWDSDPNLRPSADIVCEKLSIPAINELFLASKISQLLAMVLKLIVLLLIDHDGES